MPTFTICTEAFEGLANLVSASLSQDGLAKGVIPHPLGGAQPEEVRSRAEVLWPALSGWIEERMGERDEG